MTNTNDDTDPGSLRWAVSQANNPGNHRILFDIVSLSKKIDLSGTSLLVNKGPNESMEIDASGTSGPVTIDAGNSSRIFEIDGDPSASVILKNLIITRGKAPDSDVDVAHGGGIYIGAGNVTLDDCTISESSAGDGVAGAPGGCGGGIWHGGGGVLTIVNGIISNNTAGNGSPGSGTDGADGGDGGGIASTGLELIVNNSTLENNSAGVAGDGENGGDGGNGGGIWVSGSGTMMITNVALSGCNAGPGGDGGNASAGGAGGDGGGIYLGGSTTSTIKLAAFDDCQTGDGWDAGVAGASGDAGRGGAIYVDGGSCDVGKVTISGCGTGIAGTAGTGGTGGSAGVGGGIAVGGGSFDAWNSTVARNTATGEGGGLWTGGGTVNVYHSTLVENEAPGGGGGISVDASGNLVLENSICCQNTVGGNGLLTDSNLGNSGGILTPSQANLIDTNPELQVASFDPLTFVPNPGSPAVDGATGPDVPEEDLRCFDRPFGAAADLGACELTRQPDLRIGSRSNPDSHRGNDRYHPRGGGQKLNEKTKRRQVRFFVSVEGDGDPHTSGYRSGKAPRGMKLLIFDLVAGRRFNITANLRRGFPVFLLPGNTILNEVRIKKKSDRSRADLILTAKAEGTPTATDGVRSITKFQKKRGRRR